MAWKQDTKPNYDAAGRKYMCLEYVDNVFSAPHNVAFAKLSWQGAVGRGTAHSDRNLPNVAVPLYFSWVGTVAGERRDWGHVVVYNPGDGKLYSTRFDGDGHRTFDSIDQLQAFLPGAYLGWAEDVDGKRVAHWEADPTPAPSNGIVGRSGTAKVTVDRLYIQSEPKAVSTALWYNKGETFNYTGYIDANGYRWLTYISYSGVRRYVAQGGSDGKYVSGGV